MYKSIFPRFVVITMEEVDGSRSYYGPFDDEQEAKKFGESSKGIYKIEEIEGIN